MFPSLNLHKTTPSPQLSGPPSGSEAQRAKSSTLETPLGPTGDRPGSNAGTAHPSHPLGQRLGGIQRGIRNLAAGAAVMALAVGLTGCNLGEQKTEPRPHEPMEVHMSAGDDSVSLGTTGETAVAARLRIALHEHANTQHEGSRSRLFLHHAGEDQQLSSSELASMMEAAGVGNSDFGRLAASKAAMAFRDATDDGKLSWGEFKQIIYAPSELAEGK